MSCGAPPPFAPTPSESAVGGKSGLGGEPPSPGAPQTPSGCKGRRRAGSWAAAGGSPPQPPPAFVHVATRAVRDRRDTRVPAQRRSARLPRGGSGSPPAPARANGTGAALGRCEGAPAAGARVAGLVSVLVSHFFLGSREFSLIATKVAKLFLHFQLRAADLKEESRRAQAARSVLSAPDSLQI